MSSNWSKFKKASGEWGRKARKAKPEKAKVKTTMNKELKDELGILNSIDTEIQKDSVRLSTGQKAAVNELVRLTKQKEALIKLLVHEYRASVDEVNNPIGTWDWEGVMEYILSKPADDDYPIIEQSIRKYLEDGPIS